MYMESGFQNKTMQTYFNNSSHLFTLEFISQKNHYLTLREAQNTLVRAIALYTQQVDRMSLYRGVSP